MQCTRKWCCVISHNLDTIYRHELLAVLLIVHSSHPFFRWDKSRFSRSFRCHIDGCDGPAYLLLKNIKDKGSLWPFSLILWFQRYKWVIKLLCSYKIMYAHILIILLWSIAINTEKNTPVGWISKWVEMVEVTPYLL